MFDREIKFIYDINGYHTVLSVQPEWDNPGNEIYGLAEMFIKLIEDCNYNHEIIIEQMQEHFRYKDDNSDNGND